MNSLEQAERELANFDEMIRIATEALSSAEADRHELGIFMRVYKSYASGRSPITSIGRGKRAAVRAAAEEIIAAAGSRQHIHQLYDGLIARGIEVGGKDPKANLAGMLSRDKERFDYKNPDGWWARRLPEPAA